MLVVTRMLLDALQHASSGFPLPVDNLLRSDLLALTKSLEKSLAGDLYERPQLRVIRNEGEHR